MLFMATFLKAVLLFVSVISYPVPAATISPNSATRAAKSPPRSAALAGEKRHTPEMRMSRQHRQQPRAGPFPQRKTDGDSGSPSEHVGPIVTLGQGLVNSARRGCCARDCRRFPPARGSLWVLEPLPMWFRHPWGHQRRASPKLAKVVAGNRIVRVSFIGGLWRGRRHGICEGSVVIGILF